MTDQTKGLDQGKDDYSATETMKSCRPMQSNLGT
jgi:hypothetical protein